jgi:prolipoprotein diacylglyceryltransferase
VLFSFLFCRILYWYSHQSGFENLWAAITTKDLDTFSILGIIPGILLACVLVHLLKLNKNVPEMLDALAPGTAFGIGFLYLTCRYHQSCLGRMVITNENLMNLPIVSKAITSQGETEYRLAIYFFGFLAFFLIGILTTVFYLIHKTKKGCTACAFLLLFSSAELVLESARYDAGYLPFNGFVSIIQIVSAVCIAGSMIYYSILSVKKTGFRAVYPVLWFLHIAAIGATGYLEYLVQRHGDKAAMLYLFMSLSCFLMAFIPVIVYFCGKSGRKSQIPRKKSGA